MSRKRILFLGAHPDDIDYGCAISMYQHSLRDDEIMAIVLTEGERGGNPEIRKVEQISSLRMLAPSSKIQILTFPDTQLFSHRHEIINKIRFIVSEFLPDIVYIPSEYDFHQDHVITHECALTVLNSIRINKILCYETPSTMTKFSPNFFRVCDLKSVETKITAIKCHRTQLDKPYFSEDVIYSIAKMRAMQCRNNDRSAEAYEVLWLIEGFKIEQD